MYRAFNLTDIDFNSDYNDLVEEYNHNHFREHIKIQNNIKNFILEGCDLDGTSLQDAFFPTDCVPNIFLSHSHKDVNFAKAFAQYIEITFGLTCFIDSTVWGGINNLQLFIDTYFEENYGKKYTREVRDRVISHIHLMLNTALMHMMDQCEVFFLFNTPNSLTIDNVIGESTYSPWIFSEIEIFHFLKKKKPKRLLLESLGFTEMIKHKVNLSNFVELNSNDLQEWAEIHKKSRHSYFVEVKTALDVLYEMKPLPKLK